MKSSSVIYLVGAVFVMLGISLVFAMKKKEMFRGGGSSGIALRNGGGGTAGVELGYAPIA
jgi:LPXTG-motif cell wall-anchored protein